MNLGVPHSRSSMEPMKYMKYKDKIRLNGVVLSGTRMKLTSRQIWPRRT